MLVRFIRSTCIETIYGRGIERAVKLQVNPGGAASEQITREFIKLPRLMIYEYKTEPPRIFSNPVPLGLTLQHF